MGKYDITISVKKFGPIINTHFHLSSLTLFTGESNLGKSYANYLVYYIFNFFSSKTLDNFIELKFKNKQSTIITVEELQREMNKNVEEFMQNFLRSNSIQCDVEYVINIPNCDLFEIQYTIEELKLSSSTNSDNLLSPTLKVSINGETMYSPLRDIPEIRPHILTSFLSAYIQTHLFGRGYLPMLLPPSRGAFIGLDYTTTNSITKEGDMYRLFLKDFNTSSTIIRPKTTMKYNSFIEKVTGGKLLIEKGEQYIKMANGDKIPLSAAAASIREISPFLFSLQSYMYPARAFCFEEPEAHLHPQMQILVTDIIATSLNDDNIFHITTHSDYILQRINQLIKLNSLRKKNKNKYQQLCKEYGITKNQMIDKDNVSVYYFSKNNEGVSVEELPVSENGIAMKTFFNVVDYITRVEDDLNYFMKASNDED